MADETYYPQDALANTARVTMQTAFVGAIIAGAQNAEAAQAWVDFVFTEEFQRYHNDVANRIPVVPGVELGEGTIGLEDVTLIEGYDPTEWAAITRAGN